MEFAGLEIRKSLASEGHKALRGTLKTGIEIRGANSFRIVIAASVQESQGIAEKLALEPLPQNAQPQGYSIRKLHVRDSTTYVVLAADPVGAMYGGLDLAEAIRLGTLAETADGDHMPFIENRGIKFNIPLDVRTPSYSDAGDSAQQNIAEVWDIAFWHEFLDELARQRYNVLSLWNLHPFPSMVKVPEYPKVALADVMQTTEKFDSSYDLTGRDMVRPALLAHHEVVKKMTIEQKVALLAQVMEYAHDRGISSLSLHLEHLRMGHGRQVRDNFRTR